MTKSDIYFKRTFELARRGGKKVGNNPQVGAVIVYQQRVIGEGWHQEMGAPHAEINALKSVSKNDFPLISKSSMYVSLEPCSHYGKTPPCAMAIIKAGIKEVHIAILDPSDKVAGKGMDILEKAGIKVNIYNISEAKNLISPFIIEQNLSRPKVILKYAQSKDGFLSKKNLSTWLTNAFSKRWVHALRGKLGAILVGRKTVEIDQPALTTRFGFGDNPMRIIIDLNGTITEDHSFFAESNSTTLILTNSEHPSAKLNQISISYLLINKNQDFLPPLFSYLLKKGINTLLVEGGAFTLQSFIDKNCWDEAYVLTSKRVLNEGIQAPRLPVNEPVEFEKIQNDQIAKYRNPTTLKFLVKN